MRAPLWRPVTRPPLGKLTSVAVLPVLLFAGCGGEAPDQVSDPSGATATSSVSTPTSSTGTTTTSDTSTSPPQGGAEFHRSASVAVPAPTLVECLYGGGSWTSQGLMSDGSYAEHRTCAALREEQLATFPYVCPQTDHHVADLSDCLHPTGIPVPSDAPSPAVGTAEPEPEPEPEAPSTEDLPSQSAPPGSPAGVPAVSSVEGR